MPEVTDSSPSDGGCNEITHVERKINIFRAENEKYSDDSGTDSEVLKLTSD